MKTRKKKSIKNPRNNQYKNARGGNHLKFARETSIKTRKEQKQWKFAKKYQQKIAKGNQ